MLARGEHDAMNTGEQLARLGVPVVTLPGLGTTHTWSARPWRSPSWTRIDDAWRPRRHPAADINARSRRMIRTGRATRRIMPATGATIAQFQPSSSYSGARRTPIRNV